MSNTYKAEWTKEWPTEPGMYWFYGYRLRDWQEKGLAKLDLIVVRAKQISGSMTYIADGGFLWPQTVGDGVWTPMLVPETPPTEA